MELKINLEFYDIRNAKMCVKNNIPQKTNFEKLSVSLRIKKPEQTIVPV